MPTEGKGPIVIPCYLVDGVPYVLEVDANGKLVMRAVELETLLGGGLPAALDGLSLKVKEQSPISGFATSAKQDTMITALQLIDDLRAALLLVGTDRLGVRATELETLLGAGLPVALDSLALKVREQAPISGFATSAKQDTMITALQLIDDLRAALGSVNTDDLQVDVKTMPTVTVQAAGGDKPLSLESVVHHSRGFTATDTEQQFSGDPVPANKLWVITYISCIEATTAPTLIRFRHGYSGDVNDIVDEFRTLVAGPCYSLLGQFFLGAGEYIAVYLAGMQVNDTVYLRYGGYQMDAP